MISVICCTYNRDRVFEDTVRSFLDCGTDGIDYELLLIDNNSTDRTREIGERFGAKYPGIRYMNEPSQGHPLAKNRGIRESRGDIVAFVDDDVFFVSGWLKALALAFEDHPEIACIGGKVVPHFEAERPPWLEDEMFWIYGVTRYGDLEKEIRFPDIPIGCNMAFRRSVFEKIGNFHMSLGRKPGILLSGDEDHFLLRAERAGLKTLYAPEVRVSHRVPPARLTKDWVLSRFYWAGVSEVAMRQLGDDPYSRWKLAKKTIRISLDLLRRWGETFKLVGAIRERSDRLPVARQVDFCHRLGTLRQMIAEAAALPDGNAVCSGRPARDK